MFNSLVRRFLARWKAWPEWYQSRKNIKSWFVNWLLANCFINHAIMKLTGCYFFSASTVVRRDGLKISLPIDKIDEGPTWAFAGDDYLNELKKCFTDFTLNTGDYAIDIGAHVGTFSLALIHRFPGINVIALEPNPVNFDLLEKNRRLNRFSPETLQVKALGLYDLEGEQLFAVGNSSTTGTMAELDVYKEKDGRRKSFVTDQRVKVSCTTLNSLFDQLKPNAHCRLLKIDCEGSEYRSMRAADASVWSRVDYMVVEAHPCAEGQPDELHQWIVARGFDVRTKAMGNGCKEFYCRRA